jgi:hypothetical protein
MVTCPVCEHQQELGLECEVCGKDLANFGSLGAPPVQIAPLEGLDVTRFEAAADAGGERLEELEVTRHAAVEVSTGPVEGIEPTRQTVAGNVAIEAMPDLSPHREVDPLPRTALPQGKLVCRYCRHEQSTGALCEKCGMRMPQFLAVKAEVSAAKPEEKKRCRACGALSLPGAPCSDCGQPVPRE